MKLFIFETFPSYLICLSNASRIIDPSSKSFVSFAILRILPSGKMGTGVPKCVDFSSNTSLTADWKNSVVNRTFFNQELLCYWINIHIFSCFITNLLIISKMDIDLILTETVYFMLLSYDPDMINKVKVILNTIPTYYYI